MLHRYTLTLYRWYAKYLGILTAEDLDTLNKLVSKNKQIWKQYYDVHLIQIAASSSGSHSIVARWQYCSLGKGKSRAWHKVSRFDI